MNLLQMAEDMNLKKLTIFGFKSFMDKLEINFPCGISGVVGPNGCGKSNIIDAIRWVMGEQSPKQLRGRRMEDVIFNGTKHSKPLGMAEVSLLLENKNGSFSTGFENDHETLITRRLFRSGESDYLINNVPCRLKDIQEFFMDTGLGNKSYSIIGQGQIGNIIDQKPEETRIMLEEAASITKYRRKVQIAEKKVEHTKVNLQRVEDIQREVQGQLNSLKRQALKAKRYKELCEEIKKAEITLSANSFYLLQKEEKNRQGSNAKLIEKEIAFTTDFAKLNSQIEVKNLDLEKKETRLDEYRHKYYDLRDSSHKKKSALESLAGEIRMRQEMGIKLKKEEEDITNRFADLQEEKALLNKNLTELKDNIPKFEEEITLGEKRIHTRRRLIKEIKENYERAQEELNRGVNTGIGLAHESNYLKKLLSQVADSSFRLETELEEVKTKAENMIKASDKKTKVREATVKKMSQIDNNLKDEELNIDELKKIQNRIEGNLNAHESKLNLCQSHLISVQSLIDNFEGYHLGVRTIMKAEDLILNQQGRILGLVADIINVDQKYEQAVEAILTDKLQYIVIQSHDDSKVAIEYLKQKGKGRSSFIPVKDLKKNKPSNTNGDKYTLLSDFITVAPQYGPLINVLFRDTVLVDSLEDAILSWRKDNSNDLTFVTIEGDIVDKMGIISGGRLGRSSRGLLARKREMAELKVKVSEIKRQLEGLNLQSKNIDMEIDGKKTLLENLNKEKWDCQDEINELDKIMFRIGQELDLQEKLSHKLSNEISSNQGNHKKHEEQLRMIKEKMDLSNKKCTEEEEYYRLQKRELKETEDEYEKMRDELITLKTHYKVNKEECNSLTREMVRLDKFRDEAIKRLNNIADEFALNKRMQLECQDRQKSLKKELEDLGDESNKAQRLVSETEQDLHLFKNEIKQAEYEAEQLRKAIANIKEESSQAQLEGSMINFKLDNLVAMITDKYNLSLKNIFEQYLEENFSAIDFKKQIKQQKEKRQRMGDVNLTAIQEHQTFKDRHEFIIKQRQDLIDSINVIQITINKLNQTSLERFNTVFNDVNAQLKEIFPILFNGGTADLKLTDDAHPLDSGVLVEVKPPGKKVSYMSLLSGGEKALVAMALIFAIYMIKPSPFCLLDEVDAPLDEANIDRFNSLLLKIKKASQIIMVTHSRRAMEIVDHLYGITMEKAGMSKLVAVDMESIDHQLSKPPVLDETGFNLS